MGIFDRLEPENDCQELCVSCPKRDDGLLGNMAARITLGRSFQAEGCETGAVVIHRKIQTWTGITGALSFAFSESTEPIAIQQEDTMCGREEAAALAGQIATESFLVDGQEVEVRLMWGLDEGIQYLD